MTKRLRMPDSLSELLDDAAGGTGQFSAWARTILEAAARREIRARRRREGADGEG